MAARPTRPSWVSTHDGKGCHSESSELEEERNGSRPVSLSLRHLLRGVSRPPSEARAGAGQPRRKHVAGKRVPAPGNGQGLLQPGRGAGGGAAPTHPRRRPRRGSLRGTPRAPERPDCAECMASAHSANSAEALRSLTERLRRPCPAQVPTLTQWLPTATPPSRRQDPHAVTTVGSRASGSACRQCSGGAQGSRPGSVVRRPS